MRTVFADHPQPTVAVAERDQVFAEQADAHRIAIAFRDFLGQARRQPVAAHDLSHRGIAFHPAQQVIVFRRQHPRSSLTVRLSKADMIVLSRHITRGPPMRGVTYDWIMQTATDFWSFKVLSSTIELGVV